MLNNLSKARLLSRALENSGYFTVLSNVHRPKPSGGAANAITEAASKLVKGENPIDEEDASYYNEGLPVVSFRFTNEMKEKYPSVKQHWVQEQLRSIGWIVPK
jgi:glutamate decarboxylase